MLGCRRRILELVIFASLLPFLPPLGFSLCIGEAFPLTSAGLRAIAVFPVGLVRCPANWADSLFFPAFFIAHGIHRILMLDVVGHPLCAIDSFYCIRGTRRAVALIRPDDSVWRATDGTAIRAAKFSHIPRPFTGLVRCRLFFRLSKRHWGQYHARGPPTNDMPHARQTRCLRELSFIPFSSATLTVQGDHGLLSLQGGSGGISPPGPIEASLLLHYITALCPAPLLAKAGLFNCPRAD